jgi:hypothetical protein
VKIYLTQVPHSLYWYITHNRWQKYRTWIQGLKLVKTYLTGATNAVPCYSAPNYTAIIHLQEEMKMRSATRNYGTIALVLLITIMSTPLAFAASQTEEDYSHLDGLSFSDCSVVCDELHYSDACHAYRVENPCPDTDTMSVAGQ